MLRTNNLTTPYESEGDIFADEDLNDGDEVGVYVLQSIQSVTVKKTLSKEVN